MENSFAGPLPENLGGCKSLTRIRIKKNYFNGTIPAGIFNLPALAFLELDNNYFTGQLPAKMYSESLQHVSISNNRITGRIPPAIGGLVSLKYLNLQSNNLVGGIPDEIFKRELYEVDISGNNLSGVIPASIGSSSELVSIDFSHNDLHGEIPKEIENLVELVSLNVSQNQLIGEIPMMLGYLPHLSVLDLSYNQFFGRVPTNGQLMIFNDTIFAGNPKLCSRDILQCSTISKLKKRCSISIAELLIVFIALIIITILVIVVVCVIIIKTKRIQKPKTWKLTVFQQLGFVIEDVLECLKDENVIGKGGAGIVYRGSMPNGVDVAIKRLIGRDYGFDAEIQTLGTFKHRNIVRLLGFISNEEINLLLYEYMPHGSLGDILHGPEGEHLQWEARYKIAVEVAKGLCYLHHDCSPMIIHRDVKSNNILLDSNFEAHVADFGLAKFRKDGASEYMSCIAGSFGYIAPEYVHTLNVDEKSDVYSFGVVLLELITGKKAVGEFGDGVEIVRWVRETISKIPQLSDASVVLSILDPRLNGYIHSTVVDMLKISMMCVRYDSTTRPTMREVVYMLTNHSLHQSSLVE